MLLNISPIINFMVFKFLFFLVPVISTGLHFFKKNIYEAKPLFFRLNPPTLLENKNQKSGGFPFISVAGFHYAGFNISELSIVSLLLIITVLLVIILLLERDRVRLRMGMNKYVARDHDRQIISKDLHDNVGAQLSAAMMFLRDMKKFAGEDRGKKLLDSSLGLLETSIRDLRAVMEEWRRSEADGQNNVSAIESMANEIKRKHNIKFRISHHGIHKYLSPLIRYTLFRITHALLENTIQYAQADTVCMDVVVYDEKLVFTYEDNGMGFDQITVPKGYGLSSIEYKILSMDGFFEIATAPGNGFMALIEIPLSAG